jgi:prephenate dehydratase
LSEVDDLHPTGNRIRRQSLDVDVIRLANSVRQAVDCPYNVVWEARTYQIGKLNYRILHDIMQDSRHLVYWVSELHHHPQWVKDVRLTVW